MTEDNWPSHAVVSFRFVSFRFVSFHFISFHIISFHFIDDISAPGQKPFAIEG